MFSKWVIILHWVKMGKLPPPSLINVIFLEKKITASLKVYLVWVIDTIKRKKYPNIFPGERERIPKFHTNLNFSLTIGPRKFSFEAWEQRQKNNAASEKKWIELTFGTCCDFSWGWNYVFHRIKSFNCGSQETSRSKPLTINVCMVLK